MSHTRKPSRGIQDMAATTCGQARVWPLACRRLGTPPLICLREHPLRVFHVIRAFFQGLGIPFAPRGGEEIPAIDVNRPGELAQGIRHRMDDRLPEEGGVGDVQLCAAMRTYAAGLSLAPVSFQELVPEGALYPDSKPPVLCYQVFAQPVEKVYSRDYTAIHR
jgi:hypothetical protein